MYSGYGIAFDGAGSWNFGNDISRNVVIFGFDNSSSSNSDKRKNIFLVLGEGPTDDISVGAAEQKFSINFSKAKAKCCMSLHCNGYHSYLFINRKENL